MLRRAILMLVLVVFVAAAPVRAGNVAVNAVTGTQLTGDCVYFSSMVYASGTAVITGIELIVTKPGGVTYSVSPLSVERNDLDGTGRYVLYRMNTSAPVVSGGDVLTAVIHDVDGAQGAKSVPCSAQSKRRGSGGVSCG